MRGNGMTVYFTMIDPTRERFPVTPAVSHPGTPGTMTPIGKSRATSVERGGGDAGGGSTTPTGSPIISTSHSYNGYSPDISEENHAAGGSSAALQTSQSHPNSLVHHLHHRRHPHREHHHHHRSKLHSSLFHLSLSMPRIHKHGAWHEHAVGVFESQRYMDLENTLFKEGGGDPTVLSKCCDELLGECVDDLKWVQGWLTTVRRGRWRIWVSGRTRKRDWEMRIRDAEKRKERLEGVLNMFKSELR